MGMFAVNVVYSVGLVIPISLVHTSNDARCGMPVITSGTTFAAGLGLFLGGKYAMVLYEVFIVGASLLSLKTGKSELPRRVEIMAHATCVAVGIGVFVGLTVHWAPLAAEGTIDNDAGTTAAASDNDAGTTAAHKAYDRVIGKIDAGQMAAVRIWVAVLAVVIGLWSWSRLVLRQLEREWDAALVDANQQWDRDRKTAAFARAGPALPAAAAQPRVCFRSGFLCCHADHCANLAPVRPTPYPSCCTFSLPSLEQERPAGRRATDAEAPAARPTTRGLPRGCQATRTL